MTSHRAVANAVITQNTDPRSGFGYEKSRSSAEDREPRTVHVAYLINQYPKASHAFIRREIQALERQGTKVDRIAIRGWDAELVDPADIAEREQTQYVLADGLWPLVSATLRTALERPRQFLRALAMAVRLSHKEQRSLPYHLIYLAQACRILAWLSQSGATHLHAHFGTNPAEIALLVRLLGGPPYSFTVHGPEEFDRGPSLRLDEKIKGAEFVVAISSYCRGQLFRTCSQEDWGKIKVVHCGLDADFYQDVPSGSSGAQRLVCVGRLCEQKGQLLLLEAFQDVIKRHPQCLLVFAGGGEMRARIEAHARALGIERNIKITGEISTARVREELLAARALVLPSFQEGLPVVIMEAMALRRPVISTYVAAIPELVRNGSTGWLVPTGSISDLATAMDECLSAPASELRHMGERAYDRVIDRHAIDAEAAKLKRLFKGAEAAEVATA